MQSAVYGFIHIDTSILAAGDVKTSKQAQELALRRQRLAELVTLQISGSAVGSKEMQVATQVLFDPTYPLHSSMSEAPAASHHMLSMSHSPLESEMGCCAGPEKHEREAGEGEGG